jgi:hypothetical protein
VVALLAHRQPAAAASSRAAGPSFGLLLPSVLQSLCCTLWIPTCRGDPGLTQYGCTESYSCTRYTSHERPSAMHRRPSQLPNPRCCGLVMVISPDEPLRSVCAVLYEYCAVAVVCGDLGTSVCKRCKRQAGSLSLIWDPIADTIVLPASSWPPATTSHHQPPAPPATSQPATGHWHRPASRPQPPPHGAAQQGPQPRRDG